MRSGEILELLLPVARKLDSAAELFGEGYHLEVELADAPRHFYDSSKNLGGSFTRDDSGVSLRAGDCFWRTGFESGLALNGFLTNWRHVRGWRSEGWSVDNWNYIDPYYLLWVVFEEELAGAVDDGSGLFTREFVVSAESNSVKVSYHGVEGLEPRRYPEIFVEGRRLAAIADRIFPVRADSWIRSFEGSAVVGSNAKDVRHYDGLLGRRVSELVADALVGVEDVIGSDAVELFLEIARGGGGAKRGVSFSEAAWAVAGAFAV